MKYIGLLDCNNFFVSCERLFRPDLWAKPTVVLSSNDGCVVARSLEVKDMGIPMGVPYFQIKKELQAADTAVFSSNFQLYRDISRRVMDVLKQEVGKVEQYSVDESFFEVLGTRKEVEAQLIAVKAAVESKVGMPVSVGAAKTKTIAKYASEYQKRGTGYCLLTGESWQALVEELPIGKIWGVGGKTQIKLREQGVNTVADFLAIDPARLKNIYGIGGLRLQSELNELPVHKLGGRKELQKSIMSTRSFSATTTDLATLRDSLTYHIEHAATELRGLEAVTQSMRVLIGTNRHSEWLLRGDSREVLLTTPTNDTRVLLKEAHKALEQMFEPEVPYKKAGIVLSMLSDERSVTGSLFDSESELDSGPKIMKLMDKLNTRFGKETITVGRTAGHKSWNVNNQFSSPQYTTRWSDIACIKA